MEEASGKIIATKVMQKTEAASSVAMEKDCFDHLLKELIAKGLHIEVVVTDRSASIKKLMAESYPMINHQFDIWHVCKGSSC